MTNSSAFLKINFKLAILVHRSLHNAGPQYSCHIYYILTRHRDRFALPPSISSPNLVSTLLLPLVVFDMLAFLLGTFSLTISDLPTLTLPSNPIWKTHIFSFSFLTPNNSIRALLIRHNHVDFCVLKLYYVTLWCYVTMRAADVIRMTLNVRRRSVSRRDIHAVLYAGDVGSRVDVSDYRLRTRAIEQNNGRSSWRLVHLCS